MYFAPNGIDLRVHRRKLALRLKDADAMVCAGEILVDDARDVLPVYWIGRHHVFEGSPASLTIG